MPYVGSNGRVTEKRSPWRFSIITDFFTQVYDFVALFFTAILTPPQLDGGSVSESESESDCAGCMGHSSIRTFKHSTSLPCSLTSCLFIPFNYTPFVRHSSFFIRCF